jgi:hypothetical protein
MLWVHVPVTCPFFQTGHATDVMQVKLQQHIQHHVRHAHQERMLD